MSTMSYHNPQLMPDGTAMSGTAMRWTSLVMAPIIWFLPAIILTALCWLLTGLVFVPFGLMAAPFILIPLIYAVRRHALRRRRMNGEVILSYVDTAVRLNLPLPPFLMAAEMSEEGRRRRQLRAVRIGLETGLPVAAALQAAADVDADALAVVASYEGMGQLRTGMGRLMKGMARDRQPNDPPEDQGYNLYPLFIIVLTLFAFLFYAVFVMPRMREILRDFKAEMPPITQFVMGVTQWMDSPVVVIGLLVLGGLVIYVPVSVALQQVFLPFWKTPRFDEWFARMAWHVFPVRRMLTDRGMAYTCELLAESTAAGIPLTTAVERALQLPVNPGFKLRLANFRNLLLTGHSAADAAQRAKLPSIFVGMLAPLSIGAGGTTSGSEMFAFLGRYYRHKFSRGVMLLRAAMTPALVLISGALVLVLTQALVKPVVVLIEKAIKDGGPPL